MTDRPDFRIEIHQNKYLPAGDTQVHAIVVVEAEGGPGAMTARSTGAAEVIIVDTSGSMAGERLAAAKQAAKAAVDALRDGVEFAIISGSHEAGMVYPRDPLMARATNNDRALAKSAIARLTASGGTRMGRWLRLANALFSDYQSGIRHAILLTDGRNQHETSQELDAVPSVPGGSCATAGGSAPTGTFPSYARWPARCWAALVWWPIRAIWRRISPR